MIGGMNYAKLTERRTTGPRRSSKKEMTNNEDGKLRICWYYVKLISMAIFYTLAAIVLFFWETIKIIYNKIFGVNHEQEHS
jgi:hypothetical protein